MRKLALGAVLLAVLWAAPSQACEDCDEYFDYQSLDWCLNCQDTACGFFNCWVQEQNVAGGGTQDYCAGDDYGCFENGYACIQEPRDIRLPARLDETWRLARVRVLQPRNQRDSAVTSSTGVKKKA